MALTKLRAAAVLLCLALAAGLAACGLDRETIDAVAPEDAPDRSEPPPLVVSSVDKELQLRPFSYCWAAGGQGVCADGEPGRLPVVPADQPLTLAFDVPGWTFTANAMTSCQSGTLTLTDSGDDDRHWQLDVDGPAGTRELTIFGRGPQGDAAYALAVETTTAPAGASTGPPRGTIQLLNLTDPEASGDLVIGLEGPPEVLDVESVELVITSADGSAHDIELTRTAEGGDGDCHLTRVLGSRAAGEIALLIGGPPWTTTVTVVTAAGSAFEATVTQGPESIPAGQDDAVQALRFLPTDPPPEPTPQPPTDLGVTDEEIERAVLHYLALLADGDYEGAAAAAIRADFDTEGGLMRQAIADGHVNGGVPFPEQLRQWCAVATCTNPESVEVVAVDEIGSGFNLSVTWPDGRTADFEVAVLEGLNVLGLPPR